MISFIFLGVVLISLYKSFSQIFKRQEHRTNYISLENLLFLFMIYVNVLVGFAIVYTLFELNGSVILINGEIPKVDGFLDILGNSIYFSAITLLSVGYGDITPVGIGRIFAILEALIGYIIPAAFVVRTMIDYDRRFEYDKKLDSETT